MMPLPFPTLRFSEGKGCLQTLPSVSNEKKLRFLKVRGEGRECKYEKKKYFPSLK